MKLSARFAHLMGGARAAKPAAAVLAPKIQDDEDDKKRDDESQEDYDKRMKKKNEEKMPRDGDEQEAEAQRLQAEAEAAEESDESETRGDTPTSQARGRERARCAAIFASAAANERPDLAAQLAFDTNLTRGEAVALLEQTVAGTPKGAKTSLRERMAATPPVAVVKPGAEQQADQNDPKVMAQMIVAAAAKARGEKVTA